ncbi:nitrogen fixation/metabolism regulation signal transduction histidine kinase [Pedobacter cryoconitis]|uniref:sensor histidine kinase n=1 Tax=Pedobacter cryoconitis TaxID=188932 RepID=UPI00161A4251|nr:ATP-binding protein [Pedobacter cryoconitis]MBB6274390.1 nitrogen fixation/metabolism regulation signal transduction histidine kinase [Pedobacter cryoconitis]
MRLKIKFILFVVILHLICLVLTYFIFEKNKIVFMLAEVLIIISIFISLNLYRQLVQPLTYLKEGINAIRDKDFNVKFLSTGKKETDELIAVYNQMMDELRNERVRQEEQHFFLEKLIQTSPTGIIILDYEHQIKQINPKAAAVLSANPGLFINELQQLQAGESKIIRIGGLSTYKVQKSHFIDRGFARFFLLIEEVTAEIFDAEKNVYDKVIRMMAHEVNNTIGPVNSIMNMALENKDLWQLENKGPLKNALQVAIERNQNLNIFMRNFADLVKLSAVNKKQIDLVPLVHAVASFMQVKAAEKEVIFAYNFPKDPFYISADVQQIEQVLINLIKNAIEAIDKNGLIKFTLDKTEQKMIISDNGAGISAGMNEQLFSPFFSTKKDGQGIGLTMVREILLNHGFEFSLKTVQPGQTDFVILFRNNKF